MKTKGNWICTDPDNGQCCEKISDNEYRFVEYREVGDSGDEYFWVYKMTISVKCLDVPQWRFSISEYNYN